MSGSRRGTEGAAIGAKGLERVRGRVMGLLARRAMTRAAVERKLLKLGVKEGDAAGILDDLERRGLIDDRAYARALVREEIVRRPAGSRLLLTKLRQRGVPSAVAAKAVKEELGTRDAAEDALVLARRRLGVMGPGLDRRAVERRLMGLLARRGFDADVCIGVVRSVMREGTRREGGDGRRENEDGRG